MKKEEEQFYDVVDELKGQSRGENGVFSPDYTLTSIKTERAVPESTSPTSFSFTSLPPIPTSPGALPKHSRDAPKSFFSNLKASKSSSKIQPPEPTIRQVPSDSHETTSARSQSEASPEDMKKMASKLSLSRAARAEAAANTTNGIADSSSTFQGVTGLTGPTGNDIGGNLSSQHSQEATSTAEGTFTKETPEESTGSKPKTKLGGFLKRTPSLSNDRTGRRKPTLPPQINVTQSNSRSKETRSPDGPLTAPLQEQQNLSFPDIRPAPRNRSADRDPSPHSDRGEYRIMQLRNDSREPPRGLSNSASQNFRSEVSASHGTGSQFFSGIKNTTSRAAEGLGKAGTRLMGRIHKSNGNLHKEKVDEHYVPYTIRLPLVEQTRLTRIAKRLEDSKDKTEFWMPALPWRCIE